MSEVQGTEAVTCVIGAAVFIVKQAAERASRMLLVLGTDIMDVCGKTA